MRSRVALELSFSPTIVLGVAFNNVIIDNIGFFFSVIQLAVLMVFQKLLVTSASSVYSLPLGITTSARPSLRGTPIE